MSRLNIGTCAQPYRLMKNVSLILSNHSVSPHFQESSLRKLLENCEDPHVHTIPSMSQTETHVGSIDGQEQEEVQKKVKSRRPASTLTPMAHRFAQRNEDLVQWLMRYSALYRYRLPATAVESMAVSASPIPTASVSGSATSAFIEHTTSQTNPHAKDRFTSILCCWHHFRSNRWPLAIRKCAGQRP